MTFYGTWYTYTSWTFTVNLFQTPIKVKSIGLSAGSTIPNGMNLSPSSFSGKTVTVQLSGTPIQVGTGQIYNVVVTYDVKIGFTTYTTSETLAVSNGDWVISMPSFTHTIAYNANGGSGSMASTVVTDTNSGDTSVTLAQNGFTAPTGHYFAGWRINNGGTVYWPGNTYAVGGNASVTAYAYWLPNSYTVSLTAGTGGTVSGGGSYTYGSTANISATPNSGYKFVQWSDGDTNASRSFTVTGNVTLTATFTLAIAKTNVNVNGSWVKGSVYVNVGGIWKESKKIYVKVNGVWEESSG